MFNSIIPNVIKPTDLIFKSPQIMIFHTEKDEIITSIEKGASNFISEVYELKESTSKEVYKKSPEIWNDLINLCEDRSKQGEDNFYLNKSTNIFLVNDENELIDLFDVKNEESYDDFLEKYKQFKLEITEMTKTRKMYREGNKGLIKLIFYESEHDIVSESYTPIIILEFNNKKSLYTCYSGILIFQEQLFFPSFSELCSYKSYHQLVENFDSECMLKYATENAETLYENYSKVKENSTEISVREVMMLLKDAGYELELNNDDEIGYIKNLEDEDSVLKIKEFFNSFRFTTGENALDIINLSELRKVFRYNKLTFLELYNIFSKEYLNQDGSKLTAQIFSKIFYEMLTKSRDKDQVETIREELN